MNDETSFIKTKEELPPQGSRPGMESLDLSVRLRRYAIVDQHHKFGESVGKYGAVEHTGRTIADVWQFSTKIHLVSEGDDFDPHTLDAIANHLDRLTRHVSNTFVEIHVRVSSYDAPATDQLNAPALEEPQGVNNED